MEKSHTILLDLICKQQNKEKKQNIWESSPYKDIVTLQSNNTGIVGEQFILETCLKSNVSACIDGNKTKQVGGGYGDGIINGKTVEIKTAHQGSTNSNFQHELGECPWKADYVIFIDISPTCFYLTIFKNFDEETYKGGKKCEPYFPTKQVTWRKGTGAFKLDTTVNINEKNIKRGYTMKITETTEATDVGKFIELIFNN